MFQSHRSRKHKKKDHSRRNINSKTSETSIIILICQKLELVRPVQKNIKLPSPKIDNTS